MPDYPAYFPARFPVRFPVRLGQQASRFSVHDAAAKKCLLHCLHFARVLHLKTMPTWCGCLQVLLCVRQKPSFALALTFALLPAL